MENEYHERVMPLIIGSREFEAAQNVLPSPPAVLPEHASSTVISDQRVVPSTEPFPDLTIHDSNQDLVDDNVTADEDLFNRTQESSPLRRFKNNLFEDLDSLDEASTIDNKKSVTNAVETRVERSNTLQSSHSSASKKPSGGVPIFDASLEIESQIRERSISGTSILSSPQKSIIATPTLPVTTQEQQPYKPISKMMLRANLFDDLDEVEEDRASEQKILSKPAQALPATRLSTSQSSSLESLGDRKASLSHLTRDRPRPARNQKSKAASVQRRQKSKSPVRHASPAQVPVQVKPPPVPAKEPLPSRPPAFPGSPKPASSQLPSSSIAPTTQTALPTTSTTESARRPTRQELLRSLFEDDSD